MVGTAERWPGPDEPDRVRPFGFHANVVARACGRYAETSEAIADELSQQLEF